MILTRIDLSMGSPAIRRALGDCQQLHRLVTGLFGTDRSGGKLLYRLEDRQGRPSLYLYSAVPLRRDRLIGGMALAGERDVTDWLEHLEQGQLWGFDLLAAPMKKVASEGSRNSRRRVLRTQEERMSWLLRKAEQNGFELVNVRELEQGHLYGSHRDEQGGRMVLDSYHYQGVLRILEPEQFRQAVENGVGSGRAYGLGMLLLKAV